MRTDKGKLCRRSEVGRRVTRWGVGRTVAPSDRKTKQKNDTDQGRLWRGSRARFVSVRTSVLDEEINKG